MKGTEMKGIERLLDWAGTLRLSGLVWAEEMADELESTVDLIKREHAEDCCKMGLDYGAVSRVVTDMERHVSGAQGAEDSPVARWSRELREALTSNEVEKVKCGHADDVSMSAYDLLPQEERDAIAWVREHGGLEELLRMFQDADNRRVELCGALGIDLDKGWSEAMAAMRLRLMPGGYTWPRDESEEKVLAGSEIADGLGHAHTVTSIEFSEGEVALHWNPGEPEECVLLGHGERARRPDSLERLEADVRDIWNEVRYHLGDYSPSDFRQQGDSVCDRIADLPCRIRTLVERDAK